MRGVVDNSLAVVRMEFYEKVLTNVSLLFWNPFRCDYSYLFFGASR
jgi:hypothetical protein